MTQPQAGNPFLTTDEEWSVVEEIRARRAAGGSTRRRVTRRNPSWAWDELILALELYLRDGLLDDRDRRVVELSEALNELPIHTVRPDEERFRNCRPPAAWDHLELSFATSMGPPFRQ